VQWGYRMEARIRSRRARHRGVREAGTRKRLAALSCARGYTLIEPLITIVLAGIFFSAMVPLFIVVIQKNSADSARNVALNLAQAKIESIRSLRYDEIATANLYAGDGFWQGRFGDPVAAVDIDGDGVAEDVTSEVVNGRTLLIHYEVVTEPQDAVAGSELYKLVTVQTGWQGSPQPVKDVVLRTAVYRMAPGPTLTRLTISPQPETFNDMLWVTSFPITLKAYVAPASAGSMGKVDFAVYASNGSLIAWGESMTSQLDTEGAYYAWQWTTPRPVDGFYTFRAVGTDTDDQSGTSWQITLGIDLGPPNAPDVTQALDGSGVVALGWAWQSSSPPGDLQRIEVWRDTDAAALATLPTTARAYIDRSVANGPHTYTLRLVDLRQQVTDVPLTASPHMMSDGVPPASFGPLGATVSGDARTVTLSWPATTDDVGVLWYRVYRDDPDRLSPVATVSAGSAIIVNGGSAYAYIDPLDLADPGTTHDYAVTAVDGALNESLPAAATVTLTPGAQPICKLTVALSGQTAQVILLSLQDNRVMEPTQGVSIKPNSKGYTWKNLPAGSYQVIARFSSGSQVRRDVVLVRDETVLVAAPG
jgi:type II secretory pathway pseudopilin PulG